MEYNPLTLAYTGRLDGIKGSGRLQRSSRFRAGLWLPSTDLLRPQAVCAAPRTRGPACGPVSRQTFVALIFLENGKAVCPSSSCSEDITAGLSGSSPHARDNQSRELVSQHRPETRPLDRETGGPRVRGQSELYAMSPRLGGKTLSTAHFPLP